MKKDWPIQNLLNFWKHFTSGSTNRRIFGAALIVAAMTILVKLAGVGKELIVAWKFGTGDDIDAFLIAFLVPALFTNVIAGSFNAAFIPTYIRVRQQEGRDAAQKLFAGVTLWSTNLLAVATVIIILTAPFYLPWIARGFNAEKLDLTFRLLWMMSPLIMLSGTITIWGAVLNAGERFALAALSPSLTPITTILFLVSAKSIGIFALAAGLLSGAILEILVLGIALKKQGISFKPRWYGFDSHLRQVGGQYIPMIAGAFLLSSTSLVDQSMAAMLAPGSVAALNYGNRIIAFPIGLTTKALSTAVIPYFSKMVALEDWTGVKQTLKRYLILIFITTVPLALLLAIFSDSITQIIFQRGEFTAQDTHVVSRIQAFYALEIPFYVGGILVVRLISAFRNNHILMWGALISLIVNIILNYLFIEMIGIAGIALSTSCVYLISFLFLLYFCLQGLKKQKNEL